jgi:hypothetical protein
MTSTLTHEESLFIYDSLPGLLSMAWAIWGTLHGDVFRIQDELRAAHRARGIAFRWSMPHRSFYTCPTCGHQDTNIEHELELPGSEGDEASRKVALSEADVHAAREHCTPFPEDVLTFLQSVASASS